MAIKSNSSAVFKVYKTSKN